MLARCGAMIQSYFELFWEIFVTELSVTAGDIQVILLVGGCSRGTNTQLFLEDVIKVAIIL